MSKIVKPFLSSRYYDRFSNMDCSKLKCSLQTSQNELWFSHFCHTLYLEVHPKHTKVMFCFLLKQIFVYIFLLKQSVMTWEIQTIFHCTFLFHCLVVSLYLEYFLYFVSFRYWQCITNSLFPTIYIFIFIKKINVNFFNSLFLILVVTKITKQWTFSVGGPKIE